MFTKRKVELLRLPRGFWYESAHSRVLNIANSSDCLNCLSRLGSNPLTKFSLRSSAKSTTERRSTNPGQLHQWGSFAGLGTFRGCVESKRKARSEVPQYIQTNIFRVWQSSQRKWNKLIGKRSAMHVRSTRT